MRNRIFKATCLAIVLFALELSAQQSTTSPKTADSASPPSANVQTAATLPDAGSAQKVVLKVGATEVTQAEIDALVSKMSPKAKAIVATQGRGPVADEYIRTLLLSQRALDEHLDAAPEVRMQIELQRAQTLAQAEYQKMASAVTVTQEEVNQYFAAHQSEFETVQVRQFLIRTRPPGTDDPKQGLTAAEARVTAESIRKALLSGKSVDKVAEPYALSNTVMMIDRKPQILRRGEMKPALEKAVFALRDGGVSEIVDMPQALAVVKVLRHQRPELKEVVAEIEAKLQRQKLDAEIETMKKKTGVWIDEDYFKGPLAASMAAPQPASSRPNPEP